MIQILRYIRFFVVLLVAAAFTACNDNDSFSANYDNIMTFAESDTLSLDTVFSNIPSPHKEKLIFNNSSDGIRITSIRQAGMNQTGFRVNVNGTYLSSDIGYTIHDMELRKGDSLRVFLELTSRQGKDFVPRYVKDSLIFTLENGRKQVLHLDAWTWDAVILRDFVVKNDTTFSNKDGMPIVIMGNIKIDTLKTLTIAAGSTLYFHSKSGIDAKGTLVVKGEKDNEVTFRSDRLDRMVDNLTYDNNPGQWGSIRLREGSYNNKLTYCDIHAGETGFQCDQDSVPNLDSLKLQLDNVTIHNMKGSGVQAQNCKVIMNNTQVSNACEYCVQFLGGKVNINNCTIAQYYPFDANRGAAFSFANVIDTVAAPLEMNVKNSIVKGYEDDVIWWSKKDPTDKMNVRFADCLLRTPHPSDIDSLMFKGSIYENVEDTISDPQHSFVLFDTDFFFYDFTPKEGSQAIGAANPLTSLPEDRKGKTRSTTKPDIGCYETDK